jgi:hypothetical protein
MTTDAIKKVHFFLNSKGGVGKSHCAVLLMQYYLSRGTPVRAFDADAVSATFSSFTALNVTRIPLMADDLINPCQFDAMLEPILTEDVNFIVDTGPSSFVELNCYFLLNKIPSIIDASGKILVANIIIAGGAMLTQTCNNLEAIVNQMPPQVEIMVWINTHFGPIEHGGKSFEEMEIYKQNKSRITGLLYLPDWTYTDHQTFGVDVQHMMREGLSFDQVQASPDFNIMAKNRLRRIQRDVQDKLNLVMP